MKKIFFFAAIAALALSSCSSDEIVQGNDPVEEGAVVFSANTLRDTRATADVISGVADLANKGGFGVFAYEQNKALFKTYSANSSYPNFMYNQRVYGCSDTNGETEITTSNKATSNDGVKSWNYSPIKYYSNNEGAKHSFFAYAPYNKELQPVFALGNAPAIRYAVGTDEYDLMWAPAIVDQEKPGVEHKLTFNFQHALSKVSIYVAPFVDTVHPTGTTPSHDESSPADANKLDKNTTIAVRSVKFVGTVASQGLLDLQSGKWTYEATDDAAYELDRDIALTKDNWTHYSTTASDNKYAEVTKDMMVIPTLNGKKLAIEIVYDVITTDEKHAVNSTITTNTITSEKEFSFEAGKAYTFLLDLGMTSVKFDAKVDDWKAQDPNYVDLPNNHYYTLLSAPKLVAVGVNESDMGEQTCKVGEVIMVTKETKNYAYECTKAKTTDPSSPAEFRLVNYQYLIDTNSSAHDVYVFNSATRTYTKNTATSKSKTDELDAAATTTETFYFIGDAFYSVLKK